MNLNECNQHRSITICVYTCTPSVLYVSQSESSAVQKNGVRDGKRPQAGSPTREPIPKFHEIREVTRRSGQLRRSEMRSLIMPEHSRYVSDGRPAAEVVDPEELADGTDDCNGRRSSARPSASVSTGAVCRNGGDESCRYQQESLPVSPFDRGEPVRKNSNRMPKKQLL